jgi:hypothetical protein
MTKPQNDISAVCRMFAAMERGEVKRLSLTDGSGNNLWLCERTNGNGFAFGPTPLAAVLSSLDEAQEGK